MKNSNTGYTQEGLAKLMQAHQAGIIEYWDGDQRIKYNSSSDMVAAIDRIRRELLAGGSSVIKPLGSQQLKMRPGYQR